ncbi:MSMEG_0565 family glycosyltransferase [Paenibacillus abyssi]|uniref:Glycosyl transferase family 1 n=1 Tax=Paenibacillus abyssi TaxID=1340531 RepID=A0A917D292_9BACL|nr:MSMEG_0565 family glycosyltransferase [Paenibacillus abyssi]GGG08691.1 glycosyl transferase family 1 [Paenibacillus abyssi]
MRVALYTYNTKPRGGVVHTLALAEALQKAGCLVTVHALGLNGESQFFRKVGVDTKVIPFTPRQDELFEARIIRYIDTYAAALESEPLDAYDIHHAQDCISANSLNRLMTKGLVPYFIRTVHHLDDFTTPALVDCQNQSVVQPQALVTVSEYWSRRMKAEYGRASSLIHNGVEDRFFHKAGGDSRELKAKYGLQERTVFLALGGIEPRKNTIATLRAFTQVRRALPEAVLLIAGGTTLFDYRHYRNEFELELQSLEPAVVSSIRIMGSPDNETVQELYRLADCYVQPSKKEGWGLAILESMAAGTPVVASDIDVFQEFLKHGHNALLADPDRPEEIAGSMLRMVKEQELAEHLSTNGKVTARQYTWSVAAEKHKSLYRRVMMGGQAAYSC